MKNTVTTNDKLISIIIPTHNRAYIIEKCMNSIFSQTYNKFELIIVDDHSSDNTLELLNKINDTRLKFYKNKDKNGAQAARNEGIKKATGTWICFNDSDDFWENNKLQTNMDYLEKYNYNKNIVFYNDCYVYKEISNETTKWDLPEIDFYSSYKSLLTNPGPTFPGLFFHKSLIIKCGLLDESVPSYQEWDTSLILAKNGANFCHIKEPLFIYNLHSGETISKDMLRDFNGYQYIINKYKDEIIKHCGIEIWKQHIKIQYRKIMNYVLPSLYQYKDTVLSKNINIVLSDIESYLSVDSVKNENYILNIIKRIIKKILRLLHIKK
jgi:glycosyltransferase involved in cell wall biosynthesis